MKIEVGTFLGRIPFASVGDNTRPIVVLSGGGAFVQRQTRDRILQDVDRVANFLPPGRGFVVLGYDQAPGEDHRLSNVVEDVTAILDEIGGPVQLAGVSYGGIVALQAAAARPALVSHLVLVASAYDFSAEGKRRVEQQIEHARRGDYASLVESFAAVSRRRWLNWLLRARLRSQKARLAELMNDTPTIVRGLRALVDAPLADTAALAGITAKTMIVGGSADQFFGEGMMERTAELVPGATLALLPGETHLLPIEKARAVAAKLRAFLA
jgi:pimeloyl-ACP methyl ester carboxylesterase